MRLWTVTWVGSRNLKTQIQSLEWRRAPGQFLMGKGYLLLSFIFSVPAPQQEFNKFLLNWNHHLPAHNRTVNSLKAGSTLGDSFILETSHTPDTPWLPMCIMAKSLILKHFRTIGRWVKQARVASGSCGTADHAADRWPRLPHHLTFWPKCQKPRFLLEFFQRS